MTEPLVEQPGVDATVELVGLDAQNGWRYYRVDLGWVRVWSDGCIDAHHPLPWDVLAGYCVLVDGPYYPHVGRIDHQGQPHVGGVVRPTEVAP